MSIDGWFPVHRADLAKIEGGAGCGAGTLKVVWLALLDIGNKRHAATFCVTVAEIARTGGLSYRATASALTQLADIGLLRVTPRRVEGTRGHDSSEYTLVSSVPPSADCAEPSASPAEPLRHGVPNPLGTTCRQRYKKDKEIRERSLTPSTFKEEAATANAGRLDDAELTRFCGYWLEKSAKGRCRFEGEKYFDLSRRIGTWAGRLPRPPARPSGMRQAVAVAPVGGLVRRPD